MNLLLDTHAFIWHAISPAKLSSQALASINAPSNSILLSQVSIWEMQIKQGIGKLTLPMAVKDMVKMLCEQNEFGILTLSNDHLWTLDDLPLHHKDPFDRLLIAQAQVEGLTLVSKDKHIPKYDVDVLW